MSNKNFRSRLYLSDLIYNSGIKNKNEVKEFYPIQVYDTDDELIGVAFITPTEQKRSFNRGKKNKEDAEMVLANSSVTEKSNSAIWIGVSLICFSLGVLAGVLF